MFRYDYKPKDQLSENGPEKILLKEGKAHFRIHSLYDKDKEGNPAKTADGTPKLTLVLHVTDQVGQLGLVYDTLTSNTSWKIASLSDAIAMSDLYNANGVLNTKNLIGQEGECMIKTDSYQGIEKSVIAKYLPHPELGISPSNGPIQNEDDDLPF